MMGFRFQRGQSAPTVGYMVDETDCGPLCQHPGCWQSTNRRIKNIPNYVPRPPTPEDDELDLPTVKVYNMLEDYGDDKRDLYPAKYDGKPMHMRQWSGHKPGKNRQNSMKMTKAPNATPDTQEIKKQKEEMLNKKLMKFVEVQEVFDLEDLNSTWDDTFMPKQYLVWVPKKKKKKHEPQLAIEGGTTIGQMSQGSAKNVLVKDLTEDMIPRSIEYERIMSKSESFDKYLQDLIKPEVWPVLKKRRARSPTYSGYYRPMTYSSTDARSLPGKPFFDADGIDDLLDLPKDILVQVLDHAKQSDFMSRERIHEIIQRFLPPYDRMFTTLTTASTDLLQQKKMDLHETKQRHIRQVHLMETKPVFYLDDELEEYIDNGDPETGRKSPRQQLQFDSYGSMRSLFQLQSKKPLPPIEKQKVSTVSLGLPELPSGIKSTKAFTYSKKNYRDVDFSIGPMPTPPSTVRGSEHTLVAGSGRDSGLHGDMQSPHLPTPSPVPPVELPKARQDTMDTTARSTMRSPADRPLHAVSPSLSTRVPKGPVTTPLTPAVPYFRDPSSVSQDENIRSRSPTQNIRAPMNSPRELSPERTGLQTIEETQKEGTPENEKIPSRESQKVRFRTEVPEVPPPPSSPEVGNPDVGANSALTTPAPEDRDKARSSDTFITNQNTVNTMEKQLTQTDFLASATERVKRDATFTSSPEPWPQVNEADFDITPASTNLALHSEQSRPKDSRLATADQRGSTQQRLSDDLSRGSSAGGKRSADDMSKASDSPAPPPPSPEAKDKSGSDVGSSKSGRRVDMKSRESTTMSPLLEHDEERAEGEVRTIVVSVPPLGNVHKKGKKYRTVDTFVNIDIPAVDVWASESNEDQAETTAANNKLEPTVEEANEEDDSESKGKTLNTREALSGMSSLGKTSMEGRESMSDMASAGVTPSMAGNVSPTSPMASKDVNTVDLRNFIVGKESTETPAEEAKADDRNGLSEGPESSRTRDGEVNTDITEEGGDHEGFKQELREEMERMSKE